MPKARCKNCSDPTSFGNAVLEREQLGWCPACFKHYQPSKDDHPLVSCARCGRDTRSWTGLCSECRGTGSREQAGRKILSLKSIAGAPKAGDDGDD